MEINKEDVRADLPYLTQGFDEHYPLAYVSPSMGVAFQTTETSNDGSPRYSINPKSDSTYSIEVINSQDGFNWTPVTTFNELYLVMQISNLKFDILNHQSDKRAQLQSFLSDWKIETERFSRLSEDLNQSSNRLVQLNQKMHKVCNELGVKVSQLNISIK